MTVKKALEYITADNNTETTINLKKILPEINYSQNKIELTFNYYILEPNTTNPTPHLNHFIGKADTGEQVRAGGQSKESQTILKHFSPTNIPLSAQARAILR